MEHLYPAFTSKPKSSPKEDFNLPKPPPHQPQGLPSMGGAYGAQNLLAAGILPQDAQLVMRQAFFTAEKTSKKFPQPESTPPLMKVSEECGEFVKACIHYAEKRDDATAGQVWNEAIQAIAMILRVLFEGEASIGMVAPTKVLSTEEKLNPFDK